MKEQDFIYPKTNPSKYGSSQVNKLDCYKATKPQFLVFNVAFI